MKIAIVGAGIGGLAAAALAHDRGHQVTLIERFALPRPLGSGLVIQPVGQEVLRRIGVLDQALSQGQAITRMFGTEQSAGLVALDVRYRRHAPGLALHRGAIFEILWQAARVRGISAELGAAVTQSRMQGSQRLVLTAEGRALGPFDLVVDASGAGSALSGLVARPLPFGALWATVPWPDQACLPRDELSQAYHQASKMAGILPIGPGGKDDGGLLPAAQATFFWSLPRSGFSDWRARPLEDWKAEVVALWPEAAPFLSSLQHHDQLVEARYSHGTLKRPYQSALAHIGDAAHRASPQLGQGANMALLDALALVRALDLADLPRALGLYHRHRRWHLALYQGASALLTPLYQSHSRALPALRDRVLAPVSRLPLVRDMLTALVAGDLVPPLRGQI